MLKRILVGLLLLLSLSSTAGAVSFSADVMNSSFIGKPDVGKFYFKDKTTYRSEGMGMTHIVKGDDVYVLVSDTMKYVVNSLEELRKVSPVSVWGDAMEMVTQNNMEKVGKEILQGYDCQIYGGKILFHESMPAMEMKLWYAKELETMIKQEAAMPSPMGTLTTHFENIKIGKLDSSLFEVPKDYSKAEDMTEAMGIDEKDLIQPPAAVQGKGKMPNKEDMEKMMEQMKQMMEQVQKQ